MFGTTEKVLKCFLTALILSNFIFAQPVEAILDQVTINGLEELDPDGVIESSGLVINQFVTSEEVNDAAAMLGNSGFFSRVGFRYRTEDGRMTVTFEVQESGKFRDCLYDNFLGFEVNELKQAIRTRLPLFDGKVPEVGTSIERVVEGLQALLENRKIAGTVKYEPLYDVAHDELKFVFSIEGRGLIISEMEFLGVKAVPLVDLQLASTPLMRQEYSALQISRFIDLQVKPVFREQGYLQVDFEPPVGELVKPEIYGQKNPVRVTLNVSEGKQYRWAGAEWSGNTRLYKPALDRLLGMEMDAIADGTQLDAGLRSILDEYGKFGLMEVELTPEPDFREEESRVLYRIVIEEGRQYRMGRLEFRGFSETDIQELTERWRIKPGEIYDSSYLSDFLDNEIPAIVTSRRKLLLESKTKIDTKKLSVNVQITAQDGG